MTKTRKIKLVARARLHGAHYAWRIIDEADKHGIGPALAMAVIQKETGFRNVFGHDDVANPVKSPPGGVLKVTKKRYLRYLAFRRAGKGMQGVGLPQLTWWELQDQADLEGGCWKPRAQLRVAFRHLAGLIDTYGLHEGLKRYNGDGDKAEAYADSVLVGRAQWRKYLKIHVK